MPGEISPRLAFSGESRYLTRLRVFENGDPTVNDLELGADIIDSNNQKTRIKIIAALKLLIFREQHVIVQFWSPHVVRNHYLLTTIDQPFGIGVDDERLLSYRRDSERKPLVLDKDREEEDRSPAARVFRRGLPEWTSDVTNYLPKHFPQLECAVRCNLHGYLALPVIYLDTCVGVLELLTSAKYKSYGYEVQQLHKALRTVDLRTQQAFDCPIRNASRIFATVTDPKRTFDSVYVSIFDSTIYKTDLHISQVPSEHNQKGSNTIYDILKTICDNHSLPLAQTWAMSQHTSFVSHGKVIQKSCSSFDTRCIGKSCMSTAALPFHVKNLRMWSYREVCRVRHLDSSLGFVGKAFSSRGSSFCGDVTKLSEEEYPLVHNARMNRLTSCFAIFLHSVEANDDYVLEFFLPPDIKDSGHVLNLVQTLKQSIPIGSGFELGDSSCIHVVGPPTEVAISLSAVQISTITTTNNNRLEMVTSESESIMVNIATKTEASANLPNRWPPKQIYPDKFSNIITGTDNLIGDELTLHDSNVDGSKNNKTSHPNMITDAGEKTNRLKQSRKRKIDSLTMDAVEKHVGRPIDQAAKSLNVSRSTLKRFCREQGMASWPLPNHSKKSVPSTNLKLSKKSPKKNLQQPSNKRFGLAFAVFLTVRVKRWSCSSKSHGFSGKWWSCGMHSYLPSKSDFIYQAARLIMQLRRWKNKNSMRTNALDNGDHPAMSESTAKPEYTPNIINPYSRVVESSLVHASPKQSVANISDIKMVTVKATFNDDIIKFQFLTSSGLLELEREVARRIKLKSGRFSLKYIDEDHDLILLACDADLHTLLRSTADHSTIKLITTAYDYT